MGLILGSILFLLLWGAGYIYVNATRTGMNNTLQHALWITTVACCWMMWAIVNLAQKHPLIRPVLQN